MDIARELDRYKRTVGQIYLRIDDAKKGIAPVRVLSAIEDLIIALDEEMESEVIEFPKIEQKKSPQDGNLESD